MMVLLTWPAYGTQLRGASRGGLVSRFDVHQPCIPEPDPKRTPIQQRSLKWPAVRLDRAQQRVVLADLHRVARLRNLSLLAAVIAADHVHVFIVCDDDGDLHRVTQLIKGATARALSVASGDPPAHDTTGRPLAHQKWWARQAVIQIIETRHASQAVVRYLRQHAGPCTYYFSDDQQPVGHSQ